MVCKTKIAEKQNYATYPHCESVAHISHLQEWLKLNNMCPNCRKSVDIDEIIIVNSKKKK